jgi:hypothetical protein
MNDLKVEQLQIGNGTLSLRVSRVDNEPKLEILSNQTGYELVIL